ncbi:hypothetical protein C1752_07251 [Acaryochloris thomasi RCC1774]|uniref:Uncharacterized protein n=1 Tax=Acaryochloris thomasi RCC1774 TaxID=1764569 RepID=A0A2W1JBJ2_9CYAN|nr:hypothetical protein C1752_07251 [Acaryochloris thomasi RCC1774]
MPLLAAMEVSQLHLALIPQPLLPTLEEEGNKIKVLKVPRPKLGEGLKVRAVQYLSESRMLP